MRSSVLLLASLALVAPTVAWAQSDGGALVPDGGPQSPDGGAPLPDAGLRPVWQACKLDAAPAIDGTDTGWGAVPFLVLPYTLPLVHSGAPEAPVSNSDLSAAVQVAWNGGSLYVRAAVTDNVVVFEEPGSALTECDSVELSLDGTHARRSAYGPNDFQFVVSAMNRATATSASAFEHAALTGRGGYAVAFRVPFSELRNTSGVMGFDLGVNDRDSLTGGRKSQLQWTGDSTAGKDPRQFGDLLIDAVGCGRDAGPSAAPDAGRRDAGDGYRPPLGGVVDDSPAPGCGCTATGPSLGLALVLLLLARRGPQRKSPGEPGLS